MKLAFAVYKYFPHGGLQRNLLRIAEGCVNRGHTVDVFCLKAQPGQPMDGIRFIELKSLHLSNHARAYDFARLFGKAARGYDLRVGFNRMTNIDLYYCGDNCFLKQSEKHSRVWKLLNPRYRAFSKLERAVFDPAGDTVIMHLVDRQRDDYIHYYQTPPERFRRMPPGLQPEFANLTDREARRQKMRRSLGVAEDELMLLEIGSGFENKGIDRTIAAFEALPDSVRATLFIVGKDKIPERNNVRVLGFRSDCADLMLAADLMVHPARNEAGGNVLLEALVCHLPVIASGNCGFSPYVAESGGAVLPEPFAQADLEQTLTALVADPAKLAAMRAGIAQKVGQIDFFHRIDFVVDLIETMAADKAKR